MATKDWLEFRVDLCKAAAQFLAARHRDRLSGAAVFDASGKATATRSFRQTGKYFEAQVMTFCGMLE